MANMSVNQRNQFERVDLSVPTTGVDVRASRPVVAFTVLTDGRGRRARVRGGRSHRRLGQGDRARRDRATAVGAMIAVDPRRRS